MSAPCYAESIPAVTAPVKLPKLVPGLASYRVGLLTGGALFVVGVGLLALAVAVTT